MAVKTVGILGLGLIGGSLAKALRFRLGARHIFAVDKSPQSIKEAVDDGVIEAGSTEIDARILECDILFICTPVKTSMAFIDKFLHSVKPGCILTDVCSTKGEIIDYINSLEQAPCFIGGHPMAGSEKTGYAAGSAHLFENAYYMLCPANSATQEAVAFLKEIIAGIGAIPVIMDAKEHDRITGSISHFPHVVASALVNLVQKTDTPDAKMQMLAAGGFKDITRIASSSPEMWENIVMSNKEQVVSILDSFTDLLGKFKEQLLKEDRQGIFSFFESSKLYRDSFSSNTKGLLPSVHEIVVDVVDKPGIIGEIATLLGKHGINIKNMNISNSREFEQGCLRITLPDVESMQASLDLLIESGYSVLRVE